MPRFTSESSERSTVAPLRVIPGAVLVRETYGGGSSVREHSHESVALSVPLLGGFASITDVGETQVDGPSAALHPVGHVHGSRISDDGLESFGFFLDVDWLARAGLEVPAGRSRYWQGGWLGAQASQLARLWLDPSVDDQQLGASTIRFLGGALSSQPTPRCPPWIDRVDSALEAGKPLVVRELAGELCLHPSWLLQAYRIAKGEGLQDAARRMRVAAAWRLLRDTELGLAEIAGRAGFCDQSHMNRNFRAILGRTPLQVRGDAPTRL